MSRKVTILVMVMILVFVASIYFVISADISSKKVKLSETGHAFVNRPVGTASGNNSEPPTGLGLAFDSFDISFDRGVVNPFGVVRSKLDQSDIGHPGIDFPLERNTQILAILPGEIVDIHDAGDDFGGESIVQLVSPNGDGEGWVFIYEHVNPIFDIEIGSTVRKGQVIAQKNSRSDFTAHFQLSYAFDDYQYYEQNTCWIDNLDSQAKSEIESFWETYLGTTPLEDKWKDLVQDGEYPFRGLLSVSDFPEGPQLCYPPGTDVR